MTKTKLTYKQQKRFYEDNKDGGLKNLTLVELHNLMEKYANDEDLKENVK